MAIFDELKSIGKTLQEAGKIELYGKILEIQERLLELQKRLLVLEGENKQLKEKLEIKESLIFENHAYWIKNGKEKDGPYCSCCWDNDKKTIRMQPTPDPAYFNCPKCGNKNVLVYPEKLAHDINGSEEDFNPFAIF